MRLVHGLNRLCWKRVSKDGYELYFEGQPVVRAEIPSCGTCSDHLRKGYGDKITSAECQNTRERVNGGFQNLEQSVRDIAPMIGLFADGDYVVADYDLYPCIHGGIALLLDGHHKAAAAAWEGRLVRCIVIMHANMTGSSEWMSLNQNRTCGMQDGRQWPGTNDRSGNVI